MDGGDTMEFVMDAAMAGDHEFESQNRSQALGAFDDMDGGDDIEAKMRVEAM